MAQPPDVVICQPGPACCVTSLTAVKPHCYSTQQPDDRQRMGGTMIAVGVELASPHPDVNILEASQNARGTVLWMKSPIQQ